MKEIWKNSCKQVAEFDEVVTAKDAEIAELKSQLVTRRETRGTSPSGMSSATETATVPIVRTFRVRLLESVTIPANKTVTVPAYISEDQLPLNTSMLFEGHDYIPGVTTPCTLLNSDNARIEICNERDLLRRSQEIL